MKKALVLSLVLLIGVTCAAKTNYFDNIYVEGSFTADSTTDGWAITGTTFSGTYSTSAIFYTPIFSFGYDVGAAITFTTTDTTGAIAITHAGSGPAVTWTNTSGITFGAGTPITITGTAATDMLTIVDGNLEIQDQFGLELTGGTVDATWNPGSIATGEEEAHEVTVTGAALGDFVLVSSSIDVADLALVGQVTAADTVTCQLLNNTGGAVDLQTISLTVMVLPATD